MKEASSPFILLFGVIFFPPNDFPQLVRLLFFFFLVFFFLARLG